MSNREVQVEGILFPVQESVGAALLINIQNGIMGANMDNRTTCASSKEDRISQPGAKKSS